MGPGTMVAPRGHRQHALPDLEVARLDVGRHLAHQLVAGAPGSGRPDGEGRVPELVVGFGRIVALYYCSLTLY